MIDWKKYCFSFVLYSVLCICFSLSVLLFQFSKIYSFFYKMFDAEFILVNFFEFFFLYFLKKRSFRKKKLFYQKIIFCQFFITNLKNNFFIFFSFDRNFGPHFMDFVHCIRWKSNSFFSSMVNCCGNKIEIVRLFILFNNFSNFWNEIP